MVQRLCVQHVSCPIARELLRSHSGQEYDPSKEDIDTTNKIVQALKYVGVRVLDHIIVGRTHYQGSVN